MRIIVGSWLKFRGGNWLVAKIDSCEETEVAREDSDLLAAERRKVSNYIWQCTPKIEPFHKGDVVTTKYDRFYLEIPGKDGVYIWTKFEQSKETNEDGTEGSVSSDKQAAGQPVERPRDGNLDGQAVRPESVGTASATIHSNGRNGEEGVGDNPGVSQGS